MEKIKIFNLVIMKKQWFNYEKSKSFSEGYMKGVEHSMNVKKYIIEELTRLEKDHWDKDAFERINERLKRG